MATEAVAPHIFASLSMERSLSEYDQHMVITNNMPAITNFKKCLRSASLQIKGRCVLHIVNPRRECTTSEPFKVATLILDPKKQLGDVGFVNRLE